MEALLIILATGVMCITSFFMGSYVGSKVSKSEAIELPNIDPMKGIREKNEKAKERVEREKLEAILRNVERYNGTAEGQEDIPGR